MHKEASDEDVFTSLGLAKVRFPIRELLTIAGAIPFYGVALLLTFPSLMPVSKMAILFFFKVYSAVILSFVAGAHWAFAGSNPEIETPRFLAATNVITLSAVAMVMFFPDLLAVFAITAFILVLLYFDGVLVKHRLITKHYFGLRRLVTFLVVIALLWIAAALALG